MTLPQSDPSSSAHTTSYRIKRGSRLADIPSIDSVPSLSTMDGPFQLSEYLALMVKSHPHDVQSLVVVPSGDDASGGRAPEKNVWIYEHLRRLPVDLTSLITSLLPICSAESCPQMKADQWLYFCSAHPETLECCAIDYILHSIDSTTALLNSSHQFPSRMSIPLQSLHHFPSLFRRLSRIFSHAYFHHREAFSLSEMETSLYARFVALCERYDLVGANLLAIPRDALSSLSKPGADSEEEDEDQEDDAEEDDEEESESDDDAGQLSGYRGRGEKGDTREKRTRSLDRHRPLNPTKISATPSPGKLISRDTLTPADFPKPASPAQPKTTTSTATNRSPGNEDNFVLSPRSLGSGKATLGRGKQSRGTMLWNSDMTAVSDVPIGPELSRSESNQTAILIQEEEAAADETNDEFDEEDAVPKDEIELLEEEGIIPPETPVSPLPPPTNDEDSPAGDLGSPQKGKGNVSENKGAEASGSDKSKVADDHVKVKGEAT